eukprot:TRINITY_DN1890_c0_g2_i1.p1 TRINITY_DN1890_c0_g2~~TRINITY_DN1890_c0_g2_i1.p1  ORF type:complete len:338 (-),score=95.07 TRINITY_DN1890_c0_g2_i1:65-1078(-)
MEAKQIELEQKRQKEIEDMKAELEAKALEEKNKAAELLKEKEEQEKKIKEQEEAVKAKQQQLEEEMKAKQVEIEEQQKRIEKQKADEIVALKAQLEAENSKLKEQIQHTTDSSAKLKQDLLTELNKKEEELKKVKTTTLQSHELEEEFTCAICQELMLTPATLPCSHAFCYSCIMQWLPSKRTCPTCRCVINSEPNKARNVDNIIKKMVEKLPEAEKKAYNSRVLKQIDEADFQTLQKSIQAAKLRNQKFITITDHWTPEEANRFRDGVARYKGRTRELYCSSTGLTDQWIENPGLTVGSLRNALTNLRIPIPPGNLSTLSSMSAGKSALRNYLRGI